MNKKILIAMSGGVDSSVSAALLAGEGNYCEGAFMITHDHAESAKNDALKVADKIGIKLHVIDWRERFKKVLNYFSREYKAGRTPNPCVFCNRHIKFSGLYEYARENGLEYIATGHYCRLVELDKKKYLYQSKNIAKDQSYALAMVEQEIFNHLLLPVGDQDKNRIREIAMQMGLGVEDKPDSQEICFIPDDDYVSKLEQSCPELVKQGDVVDSEGNLLGKHTGIHNFTIGQRRGLGIALGKPAYVVELDAEKNIVRLGDNQQLMCSKLSASGVNWLIDEQGAEFEAFIKIRYNHKGCNGRIKPLDGSRVEVVFDQPVSAVTPGQAVVFYISDKYGKRLAGGAWIDRAVI